MCYRIYLKLTVVNRRNYNKFNHLQILARVTAPDKYLNIVLCMQTAVKRERAQNLNSYFLNRVMAVPSHYYVKV